MIRAALTVLVLAGACAAAAGAQDLPAAVGRVNDFAGILDADAERALDAELATLEADTSAEVAVATVPSLGGRSVEEYATALFNQWGIGQAERDNGVLVLVSVNDREMRIEVGYGLEGVLPDGLAGAIIRETFLPAFRDGDYQRGIRQGVSRVVEVVRRNEPLTAAEREALDRAAAEASQSWVVAAFLSIFVGIGAFVAGTAAGARVVVQLLFGLLFTGMALFMALLGAPRAGVALLAVFGLAVFVTGVVLGRRPAWRKSLRGTGGRSGRSGWIAGGGGGGSSSGSSGSSGSSFGGGSSGGGGASGRW